MVVAYLSGEFLPLAEAKVHVEDRGYQFGDGVYEVIRFYAGKDFGLAEHLQRLGRSASGAAIALPWSEPELAALAREVVARNGDMDCGLYIQVTRGVAPRNHVFAAGLAPALVMYPLPISPELGAKQRDGIGIVTVPDDRWGRCWIKSIDLLPNILAKHAARQAGAGEAVFVDGQGRVTEGASTNAFIVQGGRLRTAPATANILNGVTRVKVLALAPKVGLQVVAELFTEADLVAADEAFMTSTTLEVLPVVKVNGAPVRDGRPGTFTRKLQAAYRQAAGVAPHPW